MKTSFTSSFSFRIVPNFFLILFLCFATRTSNAQTSCNAEFAFYAVGDSVHFYALDNDASFYYWQFGDGTTGTGSFPWHEYSLPGIYVVCLTVNDSGTYCDWCDSIEVGSQISCDASFAHYSGSNPDSIHFYPTGSTAIDWYWSFGDGTYSNDQYPWHQYMSGGTYYACLTIETSSGATCDWCDSVEVNLPVLCNAEFGFYSMGDSAHFYALDNDANFYYWQFGDGTTSTGAFPWHEYSSSGTYYVCLTVNDSGTYCTWCDSIEIGSQVPCNAEFYHYAMSNPDSIHFYPTGSAAVSWYWSFGDGTHSTDQYPWHEYSTGGTYYVCLVITTSAGTTCDWCDSVEVNLPVLCNAEFSFYTMGDSTHFYALDNDANFYYWQFGDGTTGTGSDPWHIYSSSGVYYVCLTVNDSGTYCTWCDSIEIGSSVPCNAEFYHYAMSNPNSIHFYPTGSAAVSWYWSFGDGTYSNDQYPWHEYTSSGTYYACLTIVTSSGTTCDWCDTIEVGSQVPCNAEFYHYSMSNPDSVHFYPTGSAAVSWYWSFGDGTHSNDQYPWHEYSSGGTYYVCLTITTSAGTMCDWCDSVYIETSIPCNAEFAYYSVNNPDSVHFYSVNTTAVSWFWSFGDGSYSTNHDPWHLYDGSSDYYACLTIVTDRGDTCTWCDSIFVSSNGAHQPSVSVNPNPSRDFITVSVENISANSDFRIYDVLGRIIYGKNNLTNGKFEISTAALSNGAYYFSVNNDKEIISKGKLIVIH